MRWKALAGSVLLVVSSVLPVDELKVDLVIPDRQIALERGSAHKAAALPEQDCELCIVKVIERCRAGNRRSINRNANQPQQPLRLKVTRSVQET